MAVVILRDTGQVFNEATILEESFKVQTPDAGTIEVPTARVKTIVYKNLPGYPTDMLSTVNGSEFDGDILNDPVTIKAADIQQPQPLPKKTLLSIVWWD
jgi:hypothetical protein